MRGSSPVIDAIKLEGMADVEIITPLQESKELGGSQFLRFRVRS
jgi:hypothetical protein